MTKYIWYKHAIDRVYSYSEQIASTSWGSTTVSATNKGGGVAVYNSKPILNSNTGVVSYPATTQMYYYDAAVQKGTFYLSSSDGIFTKCVATSTGISGEYKVSWYRVTKATSASSRKGELIETVVAEYDTFKHEGITGDYWYVRGDIANNAPTLSLSAPQDGRTLYENDILNLSGAATDIDNGNVVSIKYKIDGGTTRAIIANISNGTAISFAKNLTYKSGILYDGVTAITGALVEGSQHVVSVWAEDDQGGKSAEQSRTFYVIENRPAQLTIDAFMEQSDLINTDKIRITGGVSDPDNNSVTVQYKIGTSQFETIFNGKDGVFNFDIELSKLSIGENIVTIQAIDTHASVTQKVLKVTKTINETLVKDAVAYFKILPPNGATNGIVLWIERELGDLVISADISMTNDSTEIFKPMSLEKTAYISEEIVEDQFTYEHDSTATNVIIRVNMKRNNPSSPQAIKLFSGVLS